jgi:predicted nucleic acid-binding protein
MGLGDDEGLAALYSLINRIEFITEADIPLGTWMEAHRLCKDVDDKETPYVALTLHLDGRLWTDHKALKEGLRARGFHQFYEAHS